ncbi:MAG: hypothetical protein J7604_21550 [Sporocytophaga sp.]|uniref:hypothetical protein n=1 Tax=Sporocytophaga sp. TaxID=2231183 RepID=UPI001B084315|nr:hypothetical protein [Sporocytophaga sp.]MBO9702813.1 hypothetical protein [Sporocytophaga sp.]
MTFKKHKLLLILLLISLTTFAQEESLQISWPKEYNWKLVPENDSTIHRLIPFDQSYNKWTISVATQTYKGLIIKQFKNIENEFLRSARLESPNAKLTHIDEAADSDKQWVLFKTESESFTNDPNPESSIFYVVQTKLNLYVGTVTFKEKLINKNQQAEWTLIFKTSKIVYLNPNKGFQRITDSVNHFSIEIPKSWKYLKQENEALKFIAYRTKENTLDIPRENINLNFIRKPNSNLDVEYLNFIKALNTPESETIIIKEGVSLIDNRKIKWVIETSKNENSGERMKYYSIVFYVDDTTVILTCTGLEKSFDDYKSLFERIGNSIRFF